MSKPALSHWLSLLTCSCIALLSVSAAKRYTRDLKLKYFTTAELICDHPDLNITQNADVASLSWVFPDGTTIAGSDISPNSGDFMLSEPTGDVTGQREKYSGYNLTIFDIDDDDFGYYVCVVVYSSTGHPISVIRWGLNVDGADFSDLIERYKENAIIGGVAAAAMLVIVGSGCLVWQFRFSSRNREDVEEGDDENKANGIEDLEAMKTTKQAYHNVTFNSDVVTEGGEEISMKL